MARQRNETHTALGIRKPGRVTQPKELRQQVWQGEPKKERTKGKK